MIGRHCGQRLVSAGHDNPAYFLKKCLVCGKVFKQRKRRPKSNA